MTPRGWAAAVPRAAILLAFWLIVAGPALADLPAGAAAVVSATWASLRLMPPATSRLRLAAFVPYAAYFLWQSVVAGWDVARRALDPRLPVREGFVTYRTGFPPGLTRTAFADLTSLLPGTVPAGEEDGALVYHCLDITQPVASQLAAEEARLSRVLAGPPRDA